MNNEQKDRPMSLRTNPGHVLCRASKRKKLLRHAQIADTVYDLQVVFIEDIFQVSVHYSIYFYYLLRR